MTREDSSVDIVGDFTSLSLQRSDKFTQALKSINFTIFKNVQNLGYYMWNEEGDVKNLTEVTCEDIITRLTLDAKPPLAVESRILNKNIQQFKMILEPQEFDSSFPHFSTYLPCLYAAKEKGLDLSTIDFVFGGSALDFLATRSASKGDKFIVTKIPGTKIALVVKYDPYVIDYSDPSYQFKQLVQGRRYEDRYNGESFEHLHVIDIGGFKVLFSSQADAIDKNGSTVNVKTSNPNWWHTQIAFQMISNGSVSLYHAKRLPKKLGHTLLNVQVSDLKTVMRNGVADSVKKQKRNWRAQKRNWGAQIGVNERRTRIEELENNILSSLTLLKKNMNSGKYENKVGTSQVLSIIFDKDGKMELNPRGIEIGDLFPSSDVMDDLLSKTEHD